MLPVTITMIVSDKVLEWCKPSFVTPLQCAQCTVECIQTHKLNFEHSSYKLSKSWWSDIPTSYSGFTDPNWILCQYLQICRHFLTNACLQFHMFCRQNWSSTVKVCLLNPTNPPPPSPCPTTSNGALPSLSNPRNKTKVNSPRTFRCPVPLSPVLEPVGHLENGGWREIWENGEIFGNRWDPAIWEEGRREISGDGWMGQMNWKGKGFVNEV